MGIPDVGIDALASNIFDYYLAIFSMDNHSTLYAATVRDGVLFMDVLIDTNRYQQLQLLNPTKMQALEYELASAMLSYFASRYAVERVSVRVKSAELPQDVLELRFGFNVHHSSHTAPLFALHQSHGPGRIL